MGSILTERFPYMRLVFIRNPNGPKKRATKSAISDGAHNCAHNDR
jgi:hypothetical protein